MGERPTRPDRFRPGELAGGTSAGDDARILATARELEWLAAADDVGPSAGFADRVMAAVAAEPTPRPVAAAATAARRGAPLGVLAAFRDAWRVAWTGGRPLAVRAPAMALVVVVMAATLGTGALGVGAVAGLLGAPSQSPEPTPLVSPSPPLVSPSPSPSPSPAPTGTPGPADTPEPSPTLEPGSSPETTAEPARTPRPTATPRATETSGPTDTPEPQETPHETETPKPGETPRPSETPHPEG